MNEVSAYQSEESQKNRLAAFLLCLFLGTIGIHRFYVGKIGTGILMICLCWTGISTIWAIIDLIFILCGLFKDAFGKKVLNWQI